MDDEALVRRTGPEEKSSHTKSAAFRLAARLSVSPSVASERGMA